MAPTLDPDWMGKGIRRRRSGSIGAEIMEDPRLVSTAGAASGQNKELMNPLTQNRFRQ
jgi:hypothetical protein